MKCLALILFVLIFSCSVNDHSGNGSETTDHIAGILTFDDSSKVVGAKASL